jgi:hypothetical protein
MSKRVFIVRPFGTQQGVNFDRVEETLIRPALDRIEAISPEGGTTKEIVEQGNIREDMFRELVTADLVIADVSIHNANVFYELGIRHGLRLNATFLLRANIDTYPFDLQTDRYLAYDRENPAQAVDELARALKATVESGRVDSPVYEVLPSLPAPDPAVLRVVPRDFREEVERAHQSGLRADLRLLAEESRTFSWGTEGLRTVGRAQFNLAALRGTKETFAWLLQQRPDDVEANQRLATIYERLAREDGRPDYLALSNQAIQRVIDSLVPSSWERAEACALKARNIKSRWRQAFAAKTGQDARAAALQSPELNEAFENYALGFGQDLNHFYSGLNALALLRIRIDLAGALPDVWTSGFDTDEDAQRALDACNARFAQLAAAVRLSVEASQRALDRRPDEDKRLWIGISSADLAFLTGTRPRAVAQRYREALAGVPRFVLGSVRQQLELYEQLEVRAAFVKEVLPVVDELGAGQGVRATSDAEQFGRVLLFTGHMVDAADRTGPPRFPPTELAEREARRLIREAVAQERALESGRIVAISGGACGGDILFHEVCAELDVESRLFLALPPRQFSAESVRRGGPQWMERFFQVCERLPPRVLSESKELPVWLRGKKDYNIWRRNNLWMLFHALALNAKTLTLIALWDQGKADGPGGTEDLVEQVDSRGYKVVRLPAERLRALAST